MVSDGLLSRSPGAPEDKIRERLAGESGGTFEQPFLLGGDACLEALAFRPLG